MSNWTDQTDRHEESSLIKDVAAGRAALGWAGSRVFGTLGVRSLDALEAPLLIGDYSTERDVLASGIANEMLEPLRELGLVGLGVMPGAMRKPFGFRTPFLGPQDYEGSVFRIHESLVADATLRALRAERVLRSAVEMPRAPEWADGMEVHASAIAGYGFSGFVTWNVNLWPRMPTIVANERAFRTLGTDVQNLLRDCAAHAAGRACAALAMQEQLDRKACPAGVVVVECSKAELTALREQVDEVYAELRRNPATVRYLEGLESIVAGEPSRLPR